MRVLGKAGLVLAAVLLGGCVLAPGMTMTEPAEIPDGQVVRVTPITLDLVNQMDAAHEAEIRQMAEEFVVPPVQYLIGPGDVLQLSLIHI